MILRILERLSENRRRTGGYSVVISFVASTSLVVTRTVAYSTVAVARQNGGGQRPDHQQYQHNYSPAARAAAAVSSSNYSPARRERH